MPWLLMTDKVVGIWLNSRMEVQAVALQTQVRLVLLQKVVGHRTVRIMADGAVLFHRGMLKGKGTLLIHVALEAQLVLALVRPQEGLHRRTMGIVALRAGHLPFLDGMVIGIVGFGHDVLVTGEAELRLRLLKKGVFHMLVPVAQLIPVGQLVLLAMDGVALDTGDII